MTTTMERGKGVGRENGARAHIGISTLSLSLRLLSQLVKKVWLPLTRTIDGAILFYNAVT